MTRVKQINDAIKRTHGALRAPAAMFHHFVDLPIYRARNHHGNQQIVVVRYALTLPPGDLEFIDARTGAPVKIYASCC